MLKSNNNSIKSNSQDNKISGAIRVKAGSFVIDNQWVSYDSYLFRIKDYAIKVLTANRPSFFSNRHNAVYLMVTLSLKDGINILEGNQVRYTTKEAVPMPETVNNIPLVGVILRQNGTDDLNTGFISIADRDIVFFSGTGNIVDKNLVGITGIENTTQGFSGVQGDLGSIGYQGVTGSTGDQGETGLTGDLIQGETGIQGMTGINWDVHLPFDISYELINY